MSESRWAHIWRNLTEQPDGHEEPQPVKSRFDDLLAAVAILLFAAALATGLELLLTDFGVHPGLRLIVSTVVFIAGATAARSRYSGRRS